MVKNRLKIFSLALKKWNKEAFENIETKIKEAQYNLENLHKLQPNEDVHKAIKKDELNLDAWIHRNEILWAQKSRIN